MISSFNPYIRLTFFLFTGIIFFSPEANCQIKGKIQETITKVPIPFVHIRLNNGKGSFLSDIDGNFEIPIDSTVHSITFEAYLHEKVTILPDSQIFHSALTVNMNKILLFEFETSTSDADRSVMNRVMDKKKENETSHLKYISYSTYNKATLTPEKVESTNNSLDKISKFFAFKFHTFKENQHFLIIESVTNKKTYNKHHQKEVIEGAKSTILNVPSLFIQTTQIHAFSPYEDFIYIGGKSYISPLAAHSFNRYSFTLIDTAVSSSDTIYIIKYNQLPHKEFDGLKGLLFINTKNYAVQYYTASPAKEKKIKVNGAQSFKYYPEKHLWFPDRTQTTAYIEKAGELFLATLNTYITQVDLNSFHSKKKFDEVVLEYADHAHKQQKEFWDEKRVVPLTPHDSNTYIYYDSVDQKKYIQRSLQFGEHLYYGIISYKFLNIDLHKIIEVNQLEGLRLGFGAHTNEHFSDQLTLGSYVGYGFKDTKAKFGADIAYRLRHQPVTFKSAYIDDVREAGGVSFPFNRFQYSSEHLRRLRILIMDRIIEWENSVHIHPIKFLDLKAAFSLSRNLPTYDYQFKDRITEEFIFSELKLGIRYSFAERLIQLLSRKVSLGSKFPVFYFQYTRGFDDIFRGEYKYHKYDFKAEYTLKVLDFGKTGIQLVAGAVKGQVPYTKLYNGNGSFKNVSVVAHNSFETMRYNEFLSDRYISLFMSHNFGKLYFKSKHIRPSILLLHNIGFGALNNPGDHKLISFKTMEKGYVESGMLLDNIFIFRITGLKIGLGTGFFYRYGAYSNPKAKDNFVIKLATNFSL